MASFSCGAAALHTSDPDFGQRQARRLIDYCWPHIEAGAEAIVERCILRMIDEAAAHQPAVMVLPGLNLPSSSALASGFSRRRWTARLSGRAP